VSGLTTVVFVDPTEELAALASELEAAGYSVRQSPLDAAVAGEPMPAALIFSLLGRPDTLAIRNFMRAVDRPREVATVALIRSDQAGSFDFQLGFDDFIVYPALSDEVLTRLRRAIWLRSGVESDHTLRAGDLHLDLANYKAFVMGRPVDLTYKEYELLKFLASNRDKVFTREALLNRVWGYDFYGGARTVDVHIRRLRSKIEDAHHTFIETVRNVGYRFHIEAR
jgi:two-component system alkaline phosphatase synthesis response regulator PhoP